LIIIDIVIHASCAALGAVRDVTDSVLWRAEYPDDRHELQRRYQLAPLGDVLREDHPFSVKVSAA
jgi:hypothetical protein